MVKLLFSYYPQRVCIGNAAPWQQPKTEHVLVWQKLHIIPEHSLNIPKFKCKYTQTKKRILLWSEWTKYFEMSKSIEFNSELQYNNNLPLPTGLHLPQFIFYWKQFMITLSTWSLSGVLLYCTVMLPLFPDHLEKHLLSSSKLNQKLQRASKSFEETETLCMVS